ncbi:unnamed protein product [Paramecium sonneborni]|uniref:Uncharacterized protein n=1 Tax=Paramecium sonneborni TaxID=65129 RepID=A0A8S1RQH3_9CILI|nr:unnamed protein product [Paramecium sonneborni]
MMQNTTTNYLKVKFIRINGAEPWQLIKKIILYYQVINMLQEDSHLKMEFFIKQILSQAIQMMCLLFKYTNQIITYYIRIQQCKNCDCRYQFDGQSKDTLIAFIGQQFLLLMYQVVRIAQSSSGIFQIINQRIIVIRLLKLIKSQFQNYQ